MIHTANSQTCLAKSRPLPRLLKKPLSKRGTVVYHLIVMLNFSSKPEVAERQVQAIIFYLTTFGYIDGDFDVAERQYVRDYIQKLVVHRIDSAMPNAAVALRDELTKKYTTHFHEEFERIDQHVKDLFAEAVSVAEDQNAFVRSKLKLRCFEIFQSFDTTGQEALLDTVDELILADGVAHPAEVKFRAELSELLEAKLGVELVEEIERPSVRISDVGAIAAPLESHPFFSQFEYHYSGEPQTLRKQVDADLKVLDAAIEVFEKQKAAGRGKLAGHQKVSEFVGQEGFLDDHIYVLPPRPQRSYELIVLGDLHGCYSCLKAAIMQSHFFDKVAAFRKDPEHHPDPKLVLLGDYIDRGIFGLNGVLRTALQFFVSAPEHVYVLRGNHEYYIEFNGQMFGGVKPAETIEALKPHVEVDVFKRYRDFFEMMPNMLIFDKTLLVHGGIARDLLLKERYRDLSSLNDNDIRFQMMWSDPSSADIIPVQLQEQSARFPFGRLQAAAFLQRLGCHALIRGHEKVDQGFKKVYDDDQVVLLTLFSAGGQFNADLPATSSYRSVTPMALTLKWQDGILDISPWTIEYQAYNAPERNRFYKQAPEIQYPGA
jgi:hypothetical protein